MKLNRHIIYIGMPAMLLIPPAMAADESMPKSTTVADVNGQKLPADRLASKVIGMSVRNRQNERLGNVEDLVLNLGMGRVTAVAVSSGGFLGFGNELNLIPGQSFTFNDENKLLTIDISKDELMKAPRFQASMWPDLNDREYMGKLYDTYHIDPPGKPRARANMPNAGNDFAIRATTLIKHDVKNLNEENLGQVKELVLDGSITKVVAVVLSSGGFLGLGNQLSLLPPEAFSMKGDTLRLDATKESLGKAPNFDPEHWPERINDESYLERIYSPFHIKSPVAVDNTGTNTRDRDGAKPTPQDQSNNPGDLEITRNIRQNIVAQDDLSFDAKNVKIITKGGKVTLRGPVSSQKEAERITSIAEKFATADHVTNELEVKKDNDN